MMSVLKTALIVSGCIAVTGTACAENYDSETQEQLTLECVLTNNKLASAFIAQDAAGYSLGTADNAKNELNLVTGQRGVKAYYTAAMISGGALYWIRIVRGAYEYIMYDKEQYGEMSGVVVAKGGKIVFHRDCKEPLRFGIQENREIFSRVAVEDDSDFSRIIDLINSGL
ncbi:hypothetical protein KAO45_004855 [Salmonella enterica subsp. enterica serovar Wedding]|nr:hypothetical protein [Salmonella enterica subsp. enterica serovar Wedding]